MMLFKKEALLSHQKRLFAFKSQGCRFTRGAKVLQRKPLLDAAGVKLMPTVQYSDVFSSNVILLVSVNMGEM